MSAIGPGLSRRLAEGHTRGGQEYVAAPVLGSPSYAKARKLFVLAAGAPSAIAKLRSLIERQG